MKTKAVLKRFSRVPQSTTSFAPRLGELIETEAVSHLVHRDEVPTPFVLVNTAVIDANLALFRRHLPDVQLFYAMKANSSSVVLRRMIEQGVSFDAASSHEISVLEALGVAGDSILLSHPVKDFQTIRKMVASNIPSMAVDSIDELEKYAAESGGHRPEVFVRIRTESKDVKIDLNDKFGCRLNEAADILEHAQKLGFTPRGVTFHVGSQSYSAENYKVGLDHCLLVARIAQSRFGIDLTTFNIGGGFCDAEIAAKHGTSLDRLLAEVGVEVQKVTQLGFKVIAEPGRSLVAEAGSLVCRVIGINRRGGPPLVHIDDGLYGVLSAQTYEERVYKISVLERRGGHEPLETDTFPVRLCGRTCDSLDMISGFHRLPVNVRIGDVLIIPNTGAYGTTNWSHFNGFSLPETFGVHFDGLRAHITAGGVGRRNDSAADSVRRAATA